MFLFSYVALKRWKSTTCSDSSLLVRLFGTFSVGDIPDSWLWTKDLGLSLRFRVSGLGFVKVPGRQANLSVVAQVSNTGGIDYDSRNVYTVDCVKPIFRGKPQVRPHGIWGFPKFGVPY